MNKTPAEKLARNAAYQEQHKERLKIYQIQYKQKHAAKHAVYQKAYRLTHRVERNNLENKRRARKAGNGIFLVTARDLNRLLIRWDYACAYCGSKEKLQWDHVIPIARGGRHSIGNLLPACARCNSSKRAKFIVEWRRHAEC